MAMVLSAPLGAFCRSSTVPHDVQISPAMLKLVEVVVRAVKLGFEQVIAVLLIACSCMGPLKAGSAFVRVRVAGSIRIVGLVAAESC